ncbi:hypothetical protein D3C77_297250 [compost metagenome]
MDIAGARLGVGSIQRLDQVAHAQPVGGHARRVRAHRILLHIAANGVDAGKAGGCSHLRRDDPVLHGAQVGGALLGGGQEIALGRQIPTPSLPAGLPPLGRVGGGEGLVVDRPHQDFAKARRDRRQRRLDALRHGFPRLGQSLGHLLTCEIDVRLVSEDDRDLAEAVAAQRPGRGQAGNAGHGGLDRIGDLALDLFGREGRRDGGDLHLPVSDVRHGVDGKPCQLEQSVGRDQRRDQDNEPAEFYRLFNDEFKHAARP